MENNDKLGKNIGIVAIVIVIVYVIISCVNATKVVINNDEIEENTVACEEFVGGSFSISFVTNSDEVIDDMNVCIACGPDSYENLPVPTKDGYTFDGWYYDTEFTNKVDGESSLDVIPVEITDENGCKTGYEVITLYAKYLEK